MNPRVRRQEEGDFPCGLTVFWPNEPPELGSADRQLAFWASGIADRTLGVVTVPVATPLPNARVHILEPPSVRLLLARLNSAVFIKPSIVTQ